MITIPAITLFVVGLLMFLLGYEAAIHWWRHKRRMIEATVKSLEANMLTLQAQLDKDPARAGINHGQLYILNQIENFTALLKEQIQT